MLPVAVFSGSGGHFEVPSVGIGHRAVAVERRYSVEHLDLDHVVALPGCLLKIVLGFVAVKTLRQKPARIPEPEEWSAVGMLKVKAVIGYLKVAVAPWPFGRVAFDRTNGRQA